MRTDYMVASPYLMSVKLDQVEVYQHAGLQEVNRIPCVVPSYIAGTHLLSLHSSYKLT